MARRQVEVVVGRLAIRRAPAVGLHRDDQIADRDIRKRDRMVARRVTPSGNDPLARAGRQRGEQPTVRGRIEDLPGLGMRQRFDQRSRFADIVAGVMQQFDDPPQACQAVEANRKALEQFVSGGVSLSEKPLKEALANVEKMEDVFFAAVAKASEASGPLQGPWENALDVFKMKGSATGTQATQTVQAVLSQAQAMLRDGRSSGVRAAQAMLDGYAAMVSGVLIGMSEGLKAGTSQAAPRAAAPAAKSASTKTTSSRRR